MRDITPRFLKTIHGEFQIKSVVTMDIDEHERNEKTARLMDSKGKWQGMYNFLDVIDETVSVPQQRKLMEDGVLNDEMSMDGSRMNETRLTSLCEMSATGHGTTSTNCSGGINLTPNSGILGIKPPSLQIQAQYSGQTT